jgi:type II secretory pathway component PulJ
MNPRSRQSGFGLVELMIGLVVGMIIVGAALSLLTTTMRSSNDSIKMTRLDQELRQAMTMLTRDLRRATVWDPAADVLRVSLGDPLTVSGNTGTVSVTSSGGNLGDIGAKAVGGTLIYTVKEAGVIHVYRGSVAAYSTDDNGTYSVTLDSTWPVDVTKNGVPAGNWNILRPESLLASSGSCILFASDTDSSGTYGDDERYGYRYDDTAKAVEIRTSAAATDTCTSGGTWENLTDERSVEIDSFTVTDNSPAAFTSVGFNIAIREYTISITGHLKSDPSVTRTIQETVRVRNDRLS